MSDDTLGMDPSDIQQHRHAARVTARGLVLFRDELHTAGLSDSLCDELVAIHYRWLLAPDPPNLRELLGFMHIEEIKGEDDDDDGA